MIHEPGRLPGEEPELELEPKELIAAEENVSEDFTRLAGWDVAAHHPPAILRIRAVDFREQLVGLRARYWITSYDECGELLAIGWRDGFRVVSEVVDLRNQDQRVAEPAVWLQEEANWYRSLSGKRELPRFLAGVSRTWVDAVVSSRVSRTPSGQSRWLEQLLLPPASERVAFAVPVRDLPTVVGRRVLAFDDEGFAERDLRAISEPVLTGTGDVVVAVVDEADWYLWTGHSNNARHPSMRMVPIGSLWAES